MSSYLGADPDQLDSLGHSLLHAASRLDALRSTLTARLFDVGWEGADAEDSRRDWESAHAPALSGAVEVLRGLSEAVFRNANEQRSASAADSYANTAVAPARDSAIGRDADNRALLERLLRQEPHNPGLDVIHDRLTHPKDGRQAYLLELDPSGDGKAVIAIGNPDLAANVVTFVPGTGAQLSKVGGDLERVERMAADANQLDPTRTTSAILWLGYDAPDSIRDAMDQRYAEDAGDDLARFQSGLRQSHEGSPSHNSVIGHSYGSTATGIAARDHGLSVEDLIFVGSPGVGVDNADDLGVGGSHVWSSTAANDPIQYGVMPDLSSPLGFIPSLIVKEIQGDLIHGSNPAREDFGGNVFTSDPGTPLIKKERIGVFDVPVGVDASAHSEYWDARNESRRNIARIVTGNYEDVS